jgi:hypothetical protein
MRRIIFTLLALTFITAIIISCGGNKEQAKDKTEAYKKAEEERNKELGYTPPPPPEKGPAVLVDSLEPGTSAWVAGQFAKALADIDSSAAMSYCSDTTKLLIRALFMDQGQIEGMQRANEQGFRIKSVALMKYPSDSTHRTACVTATIQDSIDVEDCSFQLRLENGQWKIYSMGS